MRFVAALTVVAALCAAPELAAQERDPAAAEALFTEGRKAFDAGEYFTACQKFEESQRLDPAAGTLINLAACQERLGRLASAWQSWREALRYLSRSDERYPVVNKRAQALEGRLPRLEVQLAADTPRDTSVTRDGVPLGAASLGVALPVDPGKHVVVASAPGYEPREYVAHVREGETRGLVVEPGDLLSATQQTEAPAVVAATPAPSSPVADARSDSSGRRTLGFVIGGIGAFCLAAGGVTGLVALDRKNTVRDRCDDQDGRLLCDDEGLDAADSGATFATISTLSFGVGAIATAAGVWLIVTSNGSSASIGARPVAGGASLDVSTGF